MKTTKKMHEEELYELDNQYNETLDARYENVVSSIWYS